MDINFADEEAKREREKNEAEKKRKDNLSYFLRAKESIDANRKEHMDKFGENLSKAIEEQVKKPPGEIEKTTGNINMLAGILVAMAWANPAVGIVAYIALTAGKKAAFGVADAAVGTAKHLATEATLAVGAGLGKLGLTAADLAWK